MRLEALKLCMRGIVAGMGCCGWSKRAKRSHPSSFPLPFARIFKTPTDSPLFLGPPADGSGPLPKSLKSLGRRSLIDRPDVIYPSESRDVLEPGFAHKEPRRGSKKRDIRSEASGMCAERWVINTRVAVILLGEPMRSEKTFIQIDVHEERQDHRSQASKGEQRNKKNTQTL